MTVIFKQNLTHPKTGFSITPMGITATKVYYATGINIHHSGVVSGPGYNFYSQFWPMLDVWQALPEKLYDPHPEDANLALTNISFGETTPISCFVYLEYTIDPCTPVIEMGNANKEIPTNVDKDGNPLVVLYTPSLLKNLGPKPSSSLTSSRYLPVGSFRVTRLVNQMPPDVDTYDDYIGTISVFDLLNEGDAGSWKLVNVTRTPVISDLGHIGSMDFLFSSEFAHTWFMETFDFISDRFDWKKYEVYRGQNNQVPMDIDKVKFDTDVTSGNGWQRFNMADVQDFGDLNLFISCRNW
jgi:hypothetical protein